MATKSKCSSPTGTVVAACAAPEVQAGMVGIRWSLVGASRRGCAGAVVGLLGNAEGVGELVGEHVEQ